LLGEYFVETVEIDFATCQELIDRLSESAMTEQDQFLIKRIITVSRLREIAFGQKPRKSYGHKLPKPKGSNSNTPPKNKGRNPATAYTGAVKKVINHPDLKPGNNCPEPLCKGRVYPFKPSDKIRISGGAIADATWYQLERLRCNLCGKLFTANLPDNVSNAKYNNEFIANLAIHRYLLGTPFYRIEQLQRYVGIPLSDSTQWDLMEALANDLMPIYHQLLLLAANSNNMKIDDTRLKILSVMASNKGKAKRERRGMHTNGLIAKHLNYNIVLFHAGTMSSGKRLREILTNKINDDKFLVMSDAASSNNLKGFDNVIQANCLSHARRKFAEVEDIFPEECQIVLKAIGLIYHHELICKQSKYSPDERLVYHQVHSKPILTLLHQWLSMLFHNHLINENDSLGQAAKYMLEHWDKLTRFLQVPGCPLDNNMMERLLKIPIRQRKNSLFFKTERGAEVGSIITSIITTATENNINPSHYLQALLDNKEHVVKEPQRWLPWTYQDNHSHTEMAA
jgi:hypothetical protein